jgi:hypothetical protein
MKSVLLLSVAASLFLAPLAQAIPTIRITDGITTVTIQDNVGADSSPVAGYVEYSAPAGTFAGWSSGLSAGTTKPLVGSSTSPQVDLNWAIVRSGPGSGSISVFFSENNFNLASATPMTASSGGTLGTSAANTALVRTYYDNGNTVLATSTLLTSHAFSGPGAFAANDPAVAPADPAIAFTVRVDLTQNANDITSGEIHLFGASVPEGGSMVTMLGTALLALGFFAARRKA